MVIIERLFVPLSLSPPSSIRSGRICQTCCFHFVCWSCFRCRNTAQEVSLVFFYILLGLTLVQCIQLLLYIVVTVAGSSELSKCSMLYRFFSLHTLAQNTLTHSHSRETLKKFHKGNEHTFFLLPFEPPSWTSSPPSSSSYKSRQSTFRASRICR